MEQINQQDCDRICNTLEKTGWGAALSPLVREKFEKGEREFSIVNPNVQIFTKDTLEMEILVGPLKDDPSRSMLLGMNTLLIKDLKIPPVIVEGIELKQLEQRLNNPPSDKLGESMSNEQYQQIVSNYQQEISRDMKVLLQADKDVYNLFVAKYGQVHDFQNPAELNEQQAAITQSHIIQNRFSSYFNLTPLECYGLLNGRAANKDLFRKAKESEATSTEVANETGEQRSNKFNTWIKIDFEKKNPDGSFEMKFVGFNFNLNQKLKDYDFEELKTDHGRMQVNHYLKKGSLMLLNSPQGQVLVEANPEFNRLNLYKTTGEIIYNHNNYLKIPLETQVGEFVELKKKNVNDRSGFRQQVTGATDQSNKKSSSGELNNGEKQTPASNGTKKNPSTEKKTPPRPRRILSGDKHHGKGIH